MSGLQLVSASSAVDSNQVHSVIAVCPSGKKVVGGGAQVTSAGPFALTGSAPNSSSLSGWFAAARETAAVTGSWGVIASALCATVTP